MNSPFVRARESALRGDVPNGNAFGNKGFTIIRKIMAGALIGAALLAFSQPVHALGIPDQPLPKPAGWVADTRNPYHVNHYTVQYSIPRPPPIPTSPASVTPGAPRPVPGGPIFAPEPVPGTHEWRHYQVCYTLDQIASAQAALRGYTTRVFNSATTIYYWMYPAGGDYRSGRWVADRIVYHSEPR